MVDCLKRTTHFATILGMLLYYDKYGDGYISDEELIDAINDWEKGKLTDEELTIIEEVWMSGKSIVEFCSIDCSKRTTHFSSILEMLKYYDKDGDGYISDEELIDVVNDWGKGKLTDEEASILQLVWQCGKNIYEFCGVSPPPKPKRVYVNVSVSAPSDVYEGDNVDVNVVATLTKAENVSFPVTLYFGLYFNNNGRAEIIEGENITFDGYETKTFKMTFKAPDKTGEYQYAVVPSAEFDGKSWDNDIMCRSTYMIELG